MWRALFLVVFSASPTLAETCAPYPWTAEPRLEPAARSLAQILTVAPSLARPLEAMQPRLCLDAYASEAHGSFSPDTASISLSAGLSFGETTAILIHELRHLDQSWHDICLSPDLTMRDHARAVFALEADAMAIAMLIAWNMRDIDQGAAFTALQSMPNSADIAATFANTMFVTADESSATAAAFAAWYTSDTRREQYYVATCEAYLSQREDTKRTAGTLSFDPGTLKAICELPSGQAYPCREPENALPR